MDLVVIDDEELDRLNDLLEEAYYSLKGLLVASDYLADKGYDEEIQTAEKTVASLEAILYG